MSGIATAAPSLFDHREAKSGIPAALAAPGIDVAPAQLPAGDLERAPRGNTPRRDPRSWREPRRGEQRVFGKARSSPAAHPGRRRFNAVPAPVRCNALVNHEYRIDRRRQTAGTWIRIALARLAAFETIVLSRRAIRAHEPPISRRALDVVHEHVGLDEALLHEPDGVHLRERSLRNGQRREWQGHTRTIDTSTGERQPKLWGLEPTNRDGVTP